MSKFTTVFGHKIRWADVDKALDGIGDGFTAAAIREKFEDEFPQLGWYANKELTFRAFQRMKRTEGITFDPESRVWRR